MAATDYTNYGGILKRVYADKIRTLIPDDTLPIFQMFPFVSRERTGDGYFESVTLASENGITIGSANAGVLNLNNPSPALNKQANVDGYQIINNAMMPADLINKSTPTGDRSFAALAKDTVKNLTLGHRAEQVTNMIYGQVGAAITSADNTAKTLTITRAAWAPGMWVGRKGRSFDIFKADGTVTRASGAVLSDVNSATHVLSFSGSPDFSGVQATDIILPSGAATSSGGGFVYTEAMGLSAICAVQSGALFGITDSSYRANTAAASTLTAAADGVPTFRMIDNAATLAFDRGFNGNLIVLVSAPLFAALNDALVNRLLITPNVKPGRAGWNSIVYTGVAGSYEIVQSRYVKYGEMYLLPEDCAHRVGACDIRLGLTDLDSDVIRLVPNTTGYQVLSYSHQAMFTPDPRFIVRVTGVVV